jgi:glycosyltransferase involved in cell wall biosynthesis
MKILIYTDYIEHTSGYAREIKDLLPYIEKAGHEVRFVALGYNGFPPNFQYKIYPAKIEEASNYWGIEVLDLAIRDFQPDVVLTLQDFFMTRKIAFAMSLPGKHKWIHWGTLDGDPADHYSREALRWIDYILYHSKFAENEIKKIYPNINGEVLYPPINPKTWNKLDKQKLKKEYGLEDRKIMITCGRNQQRKNIPVLLDAMVDIVKQIPEILLIIASSAPTKTQHKGKSQKVDGYDYDTFIRERGLQDHILNLRNAETEGTPITDKVLNIQYNLSDVMVHPSWGEGFGLPIAEAGLSGVPTIGVNHSAVAEVVGNGGILIPWRAVYIHTGWF